VLSYYPAGSITGIAPSSAGQLSSLTSPTNPLAFWSHIGKSHIPHLLSSLPDLLLFLASYYVFDVAVK
jgi:hypothetical protein